jgi:hypothetical protein
MKNMTIRMRVRELGDWLELAKSLKRLNASGLKVNTKVRSDGTTALAFYATLEEPTFYEALIEVVAFFEKQEPDSFEISVKSQARINGSVVENASLPANDQGLRVSA